MSIANSSTMLSLSIVAIAFVIHNACWSISCDLTVSIVQLYLSLFQNKNSCSDFMDIGSSIMHQLNCCLPILCSVRILVFLEVHALRLSFPLGFR